MGTTKVLTEDIDLYPDDISILYHPAFSSGKPRMFKYTTKYKGAYKFNRLYRSYKSALHTACNKKRYEEYEQHMQDKLADTLKKCKK